MFRTLLFSSLLTFSGSVLSLPAAPPPLPAHALQAAEHAARSYDRAQVALLAELVRFQTVNRPGLANAEHPEFRAFAAHLRARAAALGFDFQDLGAALVIGLGEGSERLGLATHGDVQPADPSKWKQSPFVLDAESEPGRLIARGSEDDKGPIATALYAMKAIKDLGYPQRRRIELIVALTEESDWAPFEELLTRWTPPPLNISLDSQYPVVVAEKGWGGLWVEFPAAYAGISTSTGATAYHGGAFISQVPEDAKLVLSSLDADTLRRIQARIASTDDGVALRLEHTDAAQGRIWTLYAKGRAAHSAAPELGRNALTHLAAVVDGIELPASPVAHALDFVNALIGTGWLGERFGKAAYAHPTMGPLTLNLSTARSDHGGVQLAINLRAPAGKPPAQLDAELREAIHAWARARGIPAPMLRIELGEAYFPERAAQVEPLLSVFRHYTGRSDLGPVSIGGATHARLLPAAVNFGPAMPGVPYTGHSEHEYITREQMTLNLRMYTAMLAWLTTAETRDAVRRAAED
jgi:dipeptidase D